jgi:hypothetical protein
MGIRRCLSIVWMVAGLQLFSAGQGQPSQNPPAQSPGDDSGTVRIAPAAALSAIAGMQTEGDTEDTNNDLPQIPALLGGRGTSTAFLSELRRSNYLQGGVNVGAAYDDNPLLATQGTNNTSVSIFPNISIVESSSRMRWSLAYAGGLTINQGLPNQNQEAQNLNFDSQYRLNPHLNLRVAEFFSLTTGFFDAGNGAEVVTGSGGGGPNPSLITPLATQRSSVTTVETHYHLALNDLIGASGSFYDLHFTNTPLPAGTQSTPLTDTQTATGCAFWLHRIFRGDWGGISYRFDRITFNQGGDETQVHSFLAVNTLRFWKQFTLSGFIGPQYSANQGLVPTNQGLVPVATQSTQSSGWSVTGGANGGWQGERTSLTGGYARSVSDGGGILGTVLLQNLHVDFRRVLVPGWAVALTANRGTNQSITLPFATSASSINVTSAGIALERNVGKSVGLRLGYTRGSQEQFGLPAPNPTQTANRNRIFATLSYQWAKPLGM